MYELIKVGGYIYGERPEEWSSDNRHPCNFSDELSRRVTMAECQVLYVTEYEYIGTPKFHFHPNYVDYPA